jgi:hypothetical protein
MRRFLPAVGIIVVTLLINSTAVWLAIITELPQEATVKTHPNVRQPGDFIAHIK